MITLVAAAVEDGWALVRKDKHIYLLNPPFGHSHVAEVPDCALREAVAMHGFSEMYVEFDRWATLIAFLQEQTRAWRQVSGRPLPPMDRDDDQQWTLADIERELDRIELVLATAAPSPAQAHALEQLLTAEAVRVSIPLYNRIARLLRACRTGSPPERIERRTRERLLVSHLPGVICELLTQGQPAITGPVLDINGGGLKMELSRPVSSFEMTIVDEARILVGQDEIACLPVRELFPAQSLAQSSAIRLSVAFSRPSDRHFLPSEFLEYYGSKQFRLKTGAPVREILASVLLGSGAYHSRRRERRVRLPLDFELTVWGVDGESVPERLGTLGDISTGGLSLYASREAWLDKPWRRYSRLRITCEGRLVGERECAVSNERLIDARSRTYVRVGWMFPQPVAHVVLDALSAQLGRPHGTLRAEDATDGENIARAIFSRFEDVQFAWTTDRAALDGILACRQRIFRKLLVLSPNDCAGRRMTDRYDGAGAYLQATVHGALIGAARLLTENDAPVFECEEWTGRRLRDPNRPAVELAWFCIEPAFRSACAPGLELFRRMGLEVFRRARGLGAARVFLTVHQPNVGLCEHMGFRILAAPFRIANQHCDSLVLELDISQLATRMHPALAPVFLEHA